MTHRERLIEAGLYRPISPNEEYKRNGILFRMKEGEKVEDAPIWCVFRRDEPRRHIILEGKDECQTAELIANKLYSYEAYRIAGKLNSHDPEQPPGPNPYHPKMEMYAMCKMEDWDDWEQRHAQMKLEV